MRVRTGALAVRTCNFFLVRKAIIEFSQGRPDTRCFHPNGDLPDASIGRPNTPFSTFFVSFPTTSISSQSDIWVKCYDQNNRGCPDGLTEHPDGQLQPPFENSTESFHNKAAPGLCYPSFRTVALWLHVITIIRLWSVRTLKGDVRMVELVHAISIYEAWSSGPWRLPSGRLNFVCTSCLIENIVRTRSHIVRTVAAVFP